MTNKAKIKVIKKGKINSVETPEKDERQTKQATAREIVTTVSDWVSDFQHRRRNETRQAFEKLFSPQPKTSEV